MPRNPSLDNSPGLDDWIQLAPDGRVTVRSGKVDIGQHVSTAVAIIAAEELNIEPARIDVPIAVTGIAPHEGITSGSMSMETSGEAVRREKASGPAQPHAKAREGTQVRVNNRITLAMGRRA